MGGASILLFSGCCAAFGTGFFKSFEFPPSSGSVIGLNFGGGFAGGASSACALPNPNAPDTARGGGAANGVRNFSATHAVDCGRHDSTPAEPIGNTGMIASRGVWLRLGEPLPKTRTVGERIGADRAIQDAGNAQGREYGS